MSSCFNFVHLNLAESSTIPPIASSLTAGGAHAIEAKLIALTAVSLLA